jgi:hypothetical protein
MRIRLLTLFLIATFTFITACDGDDDQPSAQTPEASPSPGASATPPTGVVELTVGDPIELPEDLALIISTGCWQCDGPTNALVRIRRTPDGVEERTLFDGAAAVGGITGFAFDVPNGRAAVSTCGPNCSGLGEVSGREQTIIHTSTDGGATFSASAPLDGSLIVEGYLRAELIVGGPFPASDNPYPRRIYPSLAEVPRPANGFFSHSVGTELLWSTFERNTLLASDGTVLFTSTGDEIISVTPLDAAGERLAMLIFRRDPEQLTTGYRLFIGARDGNILDHEITVGPAFMHVGAGLDACTIVGNADLPADAIPTPDTGGAFFSGFLPAIIDICEGVIHPIVDPFTREPYLNGRNLIAAIQRGPFLAVAEDVGDCLNVRESASTAAATLGCFRRRRAAARSRRVAGGRWPNVAARRDARRR